MRRIGDHEAEALQSVLTQFKRRKCHAMPWTSWISWLGKKPLRKPRIGKTILRCSFGCVSLIAGSRKGDFGESGRVDEKMPKYYSEIHFEGP